ncbi:urease accessory protein UreD [Celeribacter arenosi]|uniref:Urease accessory protein UreD n=1 Tax=Celeribacter arenosi TaxID=792649 RepID=A0ABP7KCF0_9RHOB
MLDHLASAPAAKMQRVQGVARVSFGPQGLRELRQEGAAKIMLPRIHRPVPEAVFLNTAGGLTGGDNLDLSLAVENGCAATGTTQTAERAYASTDLSEPARVRLSLSAGGGATLHWLPQETILFDRARLRRDTRVELSGEARFLFVETIVLGRKAMGETVQSLDFVDRREVRRDGRPVYIDPLAIGSGILSDGEHPVTLCGARAITTIGLFAQGAQDRAAALKRLSQDGVRAGVSGWDGKLVIRAFANDAYPLRRYVIQALQALGADPLPRVWHM